MLVRRLSAAAVAVLMLLTVVAVPAGAATGDPSSGSDPVVAQDRNSWELVAEAYAMKAHNEQRTAKDATTRQDVTYSDVDGGKTLTGYTDILTVARKWSDFIGIEEFYHNPDYSDQYGHWSAAGENIAYRTIKPARNGNPTKQEVQSAAEALMQAWWNSTGHRQNWMKDSWDHFAVGASVRKEAWDTPSGSEDYWILVLTTNFRKHDGSTVDGDAFKTDGSLPPNESGDSTTKDDTTSKPGPFDDVPGDHLFVSAITKLAESGVTKGCNPPDNSRFCPDDYVTRGQMAAFLTRALDLPASERTFSDSDGHLFERAIGSLAEAGITKGCNPPDNSRFCPDDYVTRGQMAAFLTRALDLPASNKTFDDTDGHLFEKPIGSLAEASITKGCNPPDNSRFCPDDRVTRAQMAAFLARSGVLD